MKNHIMPLSVCCVLIAGSLIGCDKKPDSRKVALGAMPSEAVLPDPLARQTAGDLRKWVQNFKPSDAIKLNDHGRISFSWDEMQASYPEPARLIDAYVEQSRQGFVQAFDKGSKPLPDRLATPHTPDSVEIERLGNGKYRVVTSSKTGIQHAFLEISQ